MEYTIYFSGNDKYSNVIENVHISGFEEITGRLFLIIRSEGFSIKRDKGYILFDSISAILPDKNLKIHRIKRSVHKK